MVGVLCDVGAVAVRHDDEVVVRDGAVLLGRLRQEDGQLAAGLRAHAVEVWLDHRLRRRHLRRHRDLRRRPVAAVRRDGRDVHVVRREGRQVLDHVLLRLR